MFSGGAIDGHLHRHFSSCTRANPEHPDPVTAQRLGIGRKHLGVIGDVIRIQLPRNGLGDSGHRHGAHKHAYHYLQAQGFLGFVAVFSGKFIKHIDQVALKSFDFSRRRRELQVPGRRRRNVINFASHPKFDTVIRAADPENDFNTTILRPAFL